MSISNLILKEPDTGADGIKIKPRECESPNQLLSGVLSKDNRSIVHPWKSSSSRYLFVTVFWLGIGPGNMLEVKPIPSTVKLRNVHQRTFTNNAPETPPRPTLLEHNHATLERL